MGYIVNELKQNWKAVVVVSLAFILLSIIIREVATFPYENKYSIEKKANMELNIDDTVVKGSLFILYWVKAPKEMIVSKTDREITDYYYNRVNLSTAIEKARHILLDYNTIDELKQNSYSDEDHFSRRSNYFIESNPKLEKTVKNNLDDEISIEIKKVFFVYLNDF